MPKEIKILIPDTEEQESIDIKVISKGLEVVKYRLEVLIYQNDPSILSRADFLKQELDAYDPDYTVVEIGLDGKGQIPVLFRYAPQIKNKES